MMLESSCRSSVFHKLFPHFQVCQTARRSERKVFSVPVVMKDVKSKKPQMFLLLDDLGIPHTTHLNVCLYPLNSETHTQTSFGTKFYHAKFLKVVKEGRRTKHKYTQLDLHVGTSCIHGRQGHLCLVYLSSISVCPSLALMMLSQCSPVKENISGLD